MKVKFDRLKKNELEYLCCQHENNNLLTMYIFLKWMHIIELFKNGKFSVKK
jgi:hypothetical protein